MSSLTGPAIVALLLLSVAGLVIWIIRWSAKRERDHGADKERARTLARSAERQARIDAAMARPLGSRADRRARVERWRKLREASTNANSASMPDDE